jgi:hypothetical protein
MPRGVKRPRDVGVCRCTACLRGVSARLAHPVSCIHRDCGVSLHVRTHVCVCVLHRRRRRA